MDLDFFSQISRLAVTEYSALPFFLLQAVAIVGCVATLILYTERMHFSSSRSLCIGIIMGLSGFIMMSILHEQMQSTIKPIVLLDLIFVSGLLGGWRSVLPTLIIVSFSRLLHGGSGFFGIALADYGFFAICSVLGNRWFFPPHKNTLTFKTIFLILFWRFLTGEGAVAFIWLASGQSFHGMIETLFVRRFFGAWTISALIILPILLFYKQAVMRDRRLFYDPLTGLPNRKEIEQTLHEQYFSKKHAPSQVLMLVSLDNYQELILSRGHDWMDSFWRNVGESLSELIQHSLFQPYNPTLFSFSSHAYVVLLKNTSKVKVQLEGMGESLMRAVEVSNRDPDLPLLPTYTVSVLDVVLSDQFDELRLVQSLSIMEEQRLGTTQYCEPSFAKQLELHNHIVGLLAEWEKQGNVPVWLQPKVLLESGSCFGAEALLRAPGFKGGGYIDPHGLMRVAEKNNKRQRLEWGIVCTVVNYLEQMSNELGQLQLSVNLTPDAFNEPGFSYKIIDLLRQKNVEPSRLTIEVIETSRFVCSETVKNNIAELTDAGIRMSLDDFGTGYASISLLSQYSFYELKLDYSMISNINNPRMREAILLSVDGARRYHAFVVAEGVETEEQRDMLIDMGIRYGQGFLFGKAMPFDDFLIFAEQNRPPNYFLTQTNP